MTRGDQRRAEQQAGNDTGHEQAGDRDQAAGRERIDDRVVARRHEDRLHRRADRDVGGERARIADLGHLRNHHRADRRRVGDRRSGNSAQKRGGDDVHRRQSAANADHADQHVGEGDQALRHAALGHDRACEHEERDGQHRDLAHAVGDLEHHRFERHADPQRAGDRGEAERIRDRHAEREQDEKTAEENRDIHCVQLRRVSRTRRAEWASPDGVDGPADGHVLDDEQQQDRSRRSGSADKSRRPTAKGNRRSCSTTSPRRGRCP